MDTDAPRIPVEEWREIPGFPDYEASSLGNIRSWRLQGTDRRRSEPKPIKQQPNRDGYPCVRLYQAARGSRPRRQPVHKLVCLAFYGPMPEGMDVCRHLDDVKTNNLLANLVYGTYEENEADKTRNGNRPDLRGVPKPHLRGEASGMSKLTEEDVRAIRRMYVKGRRPGAPAIAKKFGVSTTTVNDVLTGKKWSHVT